MRARKGKSPLRARGRGRGLLGLPAPHRDLPHRRELPGHLRRAPARSGVPRPRYAGDRFGRGTVVPCAAGFAPEREWSTKFEMQSLRYTTRVDELPVVSAARPRDGNRGRHRFMTLLSRSEGLLVGDAMASKEPPQAARADRHAVPSRRAVRAVRAGRVPSAPHGWKGASRRAPRSGVRCGRLPYTGVSRACCSSQVASRKVAIEPARFTAS